MTDEPKGEALSDEVVERAARADADMAAALLEGLEALANTPMNIDFSVWSRFAFNVQMIAKRLRRAAITPAGGVGGLTAEWAEAVALNCDLRANRGHSILSVAASPYGDGFRAAMLEAATLIREQAAARLATSPTRDEAPEGDGQDQGGKG